MELATEAAGELARFHGFGVLFLERFLHLVDAVLGDGPLVQDRLHTFLGLDYVGSESVDLFHKMPLNHLLLLHKFML